MYASKTTRGFYATKIHGENMPADVVEITSAQHAELIEGQSKGALIAFSEDGHPFLADPPPNPVTADDLCAQIDAAADKARAAVVADPVRAMEYQLAAQEAQPFKEAGYPSDAVPRTVSAFAIKGRTPQEAADSILAEAAAYNEALYSLREIRLSAKAEVHELFKIDAPEQAKTLADSIVEHINSLVAGVGNASTATGEVAV